MKLLALDTSSDACSAALQVGEDIIARHVVEPRAHTRILVPMLDELLLEAGLAAGDLDGIVLGNGPGSFIGMRIAASTAQGIAFAAGLGLVPVSSLAAVAAEVFDSAVDVDVLVAQDAHMDEVYLARYARDADGLPDRLGEVRLHKAADPIAAGDPGPALAAGAGWRRYPQLLQLNRDCVSAVSDVLHPQARYLLPLGRRALESGQAISPEVLVPEYVRMKVAEKPAGRETATAK